MMRPIRLLEAPSRFLGTLEIFEGGVNAVRRAVIIGNGFARAENQSIGLIHILGLAVDSLIQQVEEKTVSKFKRIFVVCGAAHGRMLAIRRLPLNSEKELVERNIDLVYGGGSIGLMGLVSQAVHAGGRHVLGIIPKTLMPKEITETLVAEVKPSLALAS